MKLRTYILIAAVFVIIAVLILRFHHSKPATDLQSLADVMKATTSEPIIRVVQLDNESTKFMVTTGSPSEHHHYILVWSESKWQITPSSDAE